MTPTPEEDAEEFAWRMGLAKFSHGLVQAKYDEAKRVLAPFPTKTKSPTDVHEELKWARSDPPVLTPERLEMNV